MARTYTFSSDFIKRFRGYLSSKEYGKESAFSKSEYWQMHASMLDVKIRGNKVNIDGKSGFYVPPESTFVARLVRKIKHLIKEPSKLYYYLKGKMTSSPLKYLSFHKAFDAVMKHDVMAEVVLSPSRINFLKIGLKEEIITSFKEMEQVFFAKAKYSLNPQMIYAYYHQNILFGYTNPEKFQTIVEIGAGNGNFAGLLKNSLPKCKYIIVDLPETIAVSIPFLADLYPAAKILMPQEANKSNMSEHYDFVFMTPEQIQLLENDTVDLFVNIMSFMEMTKRQRGVYFELIQRCAKHGSYFFTVNDVEKIPIATDLDIECLEPPNRFSEYPWNPQNETILYEICRFLRLTGMVEVFNRLEKIKK